MPTFKVLSGSHVEGKRTYEAGETVESPNELDKIFVNKFARVSDDDSLPEDDEDEAAEGDSLGDDVTADFPEAEDAGVLVFKGEDGGWYVAWEDDPDEALNEKKLKKKEVSDFIAELE